MVGLNPAKERKSGAMAGKAAGVSLLPTSPGLQLGAQVASLRCPVLRLAQAQLTPPSLGNKAFKHGGFLQGGRAPLFRFK
jgi:hypothetical protein